MLLFVEVLFHCRGKIQDLNHETTDMAQEIEAYTQENAAFLAFEKR
jgi:hypothetical protein